MDALFESCPAMDFAALDEEILGGPLIDDNYLFYRTHQPFCGWPEVDDTMKNMWELHCTSCGQDILQAKRRKFKPSALKQCPECGANVNAKKWIDRRVNLQTRLLYYKFQRGEGRRVWLHAYRVTHNFCPGPGYERLEYDEVSRYLFEDGKAYKWTCQLNYFGRDIVSQWVRRKQVTKTVWHRNTMSSMPPYPAFVGPIARETISGSCLEYSQLDKAIGAEFDIPEYLDFYLRNPMIEYLWKFNLWYLLWDALMNGRRAELRKVFRLNARRPGDLLPGLSKNEVREIADKQWGLRTVQTYQRLKADGIVSGNGTCFEWAEVVSNNGDVVERAANQGIDGKTLRVYIEKQARRSGLSVSMVLHDYGDYLNQLRRLNIIGGDLLPGDLRIAHERLSLRLNKVKNEGLNQQFRMRRRLYRWLCWRHDGMFIRPIDSVQEITREGERQRNCVAGYARWHANGNTIICVLRRADAPGKSWHTVELNPKTLDVVQCRAFRNGNAAPEAQEFIDLWTDRLKSIKFARDAG